MINKKNKYGSKFNFVFFIVFLIISIFVLNLRYFEKGFSFDFFYNVNKSKVEATDKCLDYIVDTSEENKYIVNNFFASGMNLDDFKNVCNYKSESLISEGSYKMIEFNFDRKLHYSEIEDIIYNANRSDIVNVDIIGKSVDNRNIYGIEVGHGERVIYLDANIHSAEVASTTFLTKFLNDLVYEYESGNIEIKNALNNVKLALILTLNPDGYEVYNFGIESIRNKDLWIYKNKNNVNFKTFKYNANGVDLNRNFPTQNSGLYYNGKSLISSVSLEKTFKNGTYFGGTEMGSEPETKAAMYYIYKHYKNTVAYINMHSQGRVIYAGKPNLSNEFNELTINFANKVSDYTRYNIHGLSSEEVGEGNDGTITDFFSEMAHEFKFSTDTLRLSSSKYNGDFRLKYNTAVITLETLDDYTTDVNVFKNEYYNYGIKDLLYGLLFY